MRRFFCSLSATTEDMFEILCTFHKTPTKATFLSKLENKARSITGAQSGTEN